IIPLQPDDPLFVAGADTNFMVINRATVDANHDSVNQTTPWVDQNQTYTSHPAHQVFLRDYDVAGGRATPNGKVLDGGFCAVRSNGSVAGELMCNIANWGEVKAQASQKLGIMLHDQDVFDVPLVLTDPYGHFVPGTAGRPQLVLPPATAGGPPRGLAGHTARHRGLRADPHGPPPARSRCAPALSPRRPLQ